MMRWGVKRKSNFGIDVAELPKKEKKSISVIVLSKYFPHGPQKSVR